MTFFLPCGTPHHVCTKMLSLLKSHVNDDVARVEMDRHMRKIERIEEWRDEEVVSKGKLEEMRW